MPLIVQYSSPTPSPLFKPHFPFIFISHFILPVSEPPFSYQVCSPSSSTMEKNSEAHSYRPRVRQSPTPPTGTSTLGADVAAGASPAVATSAGPVRLPHVLQLPPLPPLRLLILRAPPLWPLPRGDNIPGLAPLCLLRRILGQPKGPHHPRP